MSYLTPNASPTKTICRALLIPDDEAYLAIVRGALQVLTFPQSWVKDGMLTPAQAANNFVDMFDRFCFNQGSCRLIGEIVTFAGPATPDPTFLACNGASLLRADYPDLFAVIGLAFGAIDSAHFNLPDIRGRAPIASGHGSGLTLRSIGDSFGEESHVITTSELASHSHYDSGHAHTEGSTIPTAILVGPGAPAPAAIGAPGLTGSGSASISSTGSDSAHNNMQPSLVLSFWIVAL